MYQSRSKVRTYDFFYRGQSAVIQTFQVHCLAQKFLTLQLCAWFANNKPHPCENSKIKWSFLHLKFFENESFFSLQMFLFSAVVLEYFYKNVRIWRIFWKSPKQLQKKDHLWRKKIHSQKTMGVIHAVYQVTSFQPS